jgi:dTDP-glucose 4,6-dehydratase
LREEIVRILVTGGCGFIGSNFIQWLLNISGEPIEIINLDALTYAGNLENLASVEKDGRLRFIKGSITDKSLVEGMVGSGVDGIINFAAESHVDRSIQGATDFVRTNIEGTLNLIEAAKRHGLKRYLQVSTDEVYGSLPADGVFYETTPIHPNNPYAATKAAADHLVLSYVHTFGMDAVITRSSNNYGPFQHPEKFIPLFISNLIEHKDCPLSGGGMQIRDWLHVVDNCRGIWAAFKNGKKGEVYNLGGGNERPNLQVAKAILDEVRRPHSLIKFVKDRPGHDRRYAINWSKAKTELGWQPEKKFEDGLRETIAWYAEFQNSWVKRVKNGVYVDYYARQYEGRGMV